MLSTTQMVVTRKAIEMLYNCTCNIISVEKYRKDNGSIGTKEVKLENQKCKISYETISKNSEDDIKANVAQITKLFIAPELKILPGSKIEVTDVMGNVTTYKSSGKPAIYQTHQEILLELNEDYA